MHKWLYLAIAILAEVIATSSLKASDGFRKLWPSVLVITCYGLSFYFLSLTLRDIPVGVVYAIWSGVGVVLVALIAWIVYRQHLDLPAIIGMVLIVAGVIVMNLFSKSVPH
jgi:small multidrug resistance pump